LVSNSITESAYNLPKLKRTQAPFFVYFEDETHMLVYGPHNYQGATQEEWDQMLKNPDKAKVRKVLRTLG